MKRNEILKSVSSYYSSKICTHGLTPQGVDWNGPDGQLLRFKQLLSVIGTQQNKFSVADIGCGYGALYKYMTNSISTPFDYIGIDISADMIKSAIDEFGESNKVEFKCTMPKDIKVDFAVASGIFNVRLDCADNVWIKYIKETLVEMNDYSVKGFSFNCLTSYSDEDKKRDYLYYADPCYLFDFCKKNFSKQVALLHDYGLYEFTIIVRK